MNLYVFMTWDALTPQWLALILETLKVSANVTNYFNKLPLCVKSTLVFFHNDFAFKHIFFKKW
jgi:hypothetical protein